MSNDQKKKKKKGDGAGAIAFGVTFVILASIFKIHGLIGLAVQLAVSGFVSSIVRTMAQGLDLTTQDQKKKQAQAQAQSEAARQQDSLEKIKGNTGNPEVDALLAKGREMIQEIRDENAKIPDEALTQKLNQLESLCASVFKAVYDKPAKATQIRKFMDYYLPTTLKMVKNYRMLGERELPTQDVQNARQRINDALGVVITGCQKMLQNLYKDDMLDITTDIDVLEQMLKRDGLTESDLEKAAEQAKQAAKIDMAASAAQKQRQAAQAAAPAQTVSAVQTAAPAAPTLQEDSGVRREMDEAQAQAQQHIPQVPTLSGEMYPTYGGQATAQAPKPE